MEPSQHPAHEYGILSATILASGMGFLAGTLVSIAAPPIQEYFQAEVAALQWILNAFALTLAVFILMSGSLSDIYGRRRVFAVGIFIFTAGSGFSAVSPNVPFLVSFQALQGFGAALMVPGSLAIIHNVFSENRRGRAIGLWAGLSGAIAAVGPLLGGWLVELFSWRAVFFVNLPLGLLTIIFTYLYIPEIERRRYVPLDWPGILLAGSGLFGISTGLILLPNEIGASRSAMFLIIAGIVLFLFFVLQERRSPHPLLPLSIFRNPLVAGANAATLLLYFALNGIIFLLVLRLQQVEGYSPLQAGLALLPFSILIALLAGSFGTLSDRLGPRPQMLYGPFLVALGFGLLALPGESAGYWSGFFPGLVLFGIGMAFIIPPLTKSALAVKESLSGTASGVNNAVARVAGLLAIAVLGSFMVMVFTVHLGTLLTESPLGMEEQERILALSGRLGALEAPADFDSASSRLVREMVERSFVRGFRVMMGICFFLAIGAAGISYVYIRSP